MRQTAAAGVLLVVVCSGGLSSPALADATSTEWWPELQFQYQATEHTRFIGMLATSHSRDESQAYQAEIGIVGEHRFSDLFRARLGYRHGNAIDGGAFHEDRMLMEQIFRLRAPLGVYVDFRTREDLRWLNTGFSARIRERVQVNRDFTIESWSVTPYASAEMFYDTRYDQLSRYRFVGGITLQFTKNFALEPYYAYQIDVAPRWSGTHALGLAVITSF